MSPLTFVTHCMDRPNALKVLYGIVKVLVTVRKPDPGGYESCDHSGFEPTLKALRSRSIPGALEERAGLESYLTELTKVDPDGLSRDEALAYWLNLYNAGAIRLAVETFERGEDTVLGVPGGFSRPVFRVAGEALSLDAIEHAKIRRFKDPRIHGALVCGSLSCPTLRPVPFTGDDLNGQLDEQMRIFLNGGAATAGDDGKVLLSRVFWWYGSDFVRPGSMPTFIPVSKQRILEAVRRWIPDELADRTEVGFQPYEWGLACAVG